MRAERLNDALPLEELRENLESLSTADLYRLSKQAAGYADGNGMTADDLFQEAVRRSLNGSRICPRDVPVHVFLLNTMRSIAHEERNRWERDKPLGLDMDETNPIVQEKDPRPTPEQTVTDNELFQKRVLEIENLFVDDNQALAIVMGDMDECSPSEICEVEPMTDKEYAAARKRIRRAIRKKFPKGRPNE